MKLTATQAELINRKLIELEKRIAALEKIIKTELGNFL